MKDYFIQLAATKPYAGWLLKHYTRSLVAIGVLGSLGAWFIWRSSSIGMLPFQIFCLLTVGAYFVLQLFLKEVLLNDEQTIPPTRNLADYFSSDLVYQLSNEKKISAFALLRATIKTARGKFVLTEIGVSTSDFLARFEHELEKIVDIYGFVVRAKDVAKELGETRIDANVILYFFFQHGGPFTELLNEKDLSLDDLKKIMNWEAFHFNWQREEYTWKPQRLLKTFGTFGRSWVLGYTNELDRLTTDISQNIYDLGGNDVVIHQPELENALHIIGRSQQQNLLIMGKSGVGKSEFITNVTQRLRTNEIKHSLPLTRVLLLHTEQLLGGTNRPDSVLLEAMSRADGPGRFLLVLEDISLILRSNDSNLIAVFTKLLRSSQVSIVGIADILDYHTLIKANTAVDSQFEKIFINDANDEETMQVMMTHYFQLEERRHLHMTFKALKSILSLSRRYIGKGGFPGKAIAILNDAMMSARRRGDNFVTETDVREMVSLKAHIDVRELTETEKTRLMHLESALSKEVIGQEKALNSLVNSLKRARMQIHDRQKPLGTFLFLGPTGVGKTETAKVLAKHYFGSKDNMIRLDMNEYSTEESVHQITGGTSSGGQIKEGYLARRVQDQPFSLILLDEIEKAHPKVLNLFLQILDEGELSDALGMATDFKNTIIIATSNAGALFIRDFIKEHSTESKEEFQSSLIDTILKQGTFSPEFMNRFDEVILYYPLSRNDALKVAIIMIDAVIRDLLNNKGIYLKMDEGVVTKIAHKGYSQEFGAREMRRTVTDVLENYIANYLLHNDIKRGQEIYIREDDIHI